MFDIGIQELIVVFLVALIVFGPKRLPELGKTLGKFMLEIKKGITDAKSQVESGLAELENPKAETLPHRDGSDRPEDPKPEEGPSEGKGEG